jgi:Tfp pilus assembly protein PilZ
VLGDPFRIGVTVLLVLTHINKNQKVVIVGKIVNLGKRIALLWFCF